MDARFWRNVILIALAHIGLLAILLHWAGEMKAARPPEITWLSGAAEPEIDNASDTEPASASMPELAASTSNSEIILPSVTPKPAPSVTPRPKPSGTPKSAAKKKPSPSASVAKKKIDAPKKEVGVKTGETKTSVAGHAKTSTGGSGAGATGTGSGKADAATATYYSNMLHDRFYQAWEQPQTVVASGAKLSATARIRIQKDGRVSDFKIVTPSGNVLVDESVQRVSRKVVQVDALPAGMSSGDHYDVNINFALNSE